MAHPTPQINFNGAQINHGYFDIILLDVPCSGSGTWGRNSQHLRFFKENRLSQYSALQKSIFKNALPFLKPDGKICYITCSVYKDENEHQVKEFARLYNLKVEKEIYLGNRETDVLFFAAFSHVAH